MTDCSTTGPDSITRSEQSGLRRWRIPSLPWMVLGLIAIVSIGIGLRYWVVLPQIRLAESFLRIGGTVRFEANDKTWQMSRGRSGGDYFDGEPPSRIAEYVPPALLYPVVHVNKNFYGRHPGDGLLSSLSRATQVKSVRLAAADFQVNGLQSLSHLSDLETLELDWSQFTAADFNHLRSLRLKKLLLEATPVDDGMLSTIAGMPTLWMLDLTGTQVSDEGLKHLAGLRNLRWVSLRRTKVTLKGARQFQEQHPYSVIEWEPLPGGTVVRLQ